MSALPSAMEFVADHWLPLSLVYTLHYPVIGFVQGLGQFIEIMAEIWGEAMLQRVQLAEYPSEPVRHCEIPHVA